jgi:glycosyltransferase involved in cell wall biosynthesis
MYQPLVTIIIPTFNRAQLLSATLDSVIAQTYTNWECIVVDDGSTDATPAVVSSYIQKDTRFNYYKRPVDQPKGANTCRNYGFEKSKGEFINWFDDDDILLPDFIESKVCLFSEEVQMVICSGYLVNEHLKEPLILNMFNSSNIFRDYLVWRLKILTPSILFRKTFLEKQRLFSTIIKRGQETELFSRLFFQLNSNAYVITLMPLFRDRQHGASKTGRDLSYNSSYAESKHIIYTQNFFRGQSINDLDVMNYCYSKNMKLFFNAIANNHLSLAIDIRRYFISKLKNLGIGHFVEVTTLSAWLILFQFPSYRLRKRWLTFEFKMK